jgi:hypothetical protein
MGIIHMGIIRMQGHTGIIRMQGHTGIILTRILITADIIDRLSRVGEWQLS